MTIRIESTDGINCPIFVCDKCSKKIENAYLANVEWRREDSAELFYLHKSCSEDFRKGKRLAWMPLTDFFVFLPNNSGFCRSRQGRAKESLMAEYEVGLVGCAH